MRLAAIPGLGFQQGADDVPLGRKETGSRRRPPECEQMYME